MPGKCYLIFCYLKNKNVFFFVQYKMYESERPTAKYLIFDFTSENQFLGKIIPVEKSQ